jgi:capsular exopolysaccharide synthesis family protein
MELQEFIAPLRKWWWLIVIATLIAGTVSYLSARQQPDQFRARTTLMIGQAIDNPNPSGAEFWLTQQLAQTYAEIASREPVRNATMAALGLNWLPDIGVRALPDTQLIEIAVSDTSAQRAQAVANELTHQLILQSPTSSEELEEQSRQSFISDQLDGLESKIEDTQLEITEKQAEQTIATGARQFSDLQNQITTLQSKLATLQSNYADLLSNSRQGAINTLNIIEPASLPTIPIGPVAATTVFVAAAIGFTLATGAAYLLEYLDDSVTNPDEVLKLTGLPTLAGIARITDDGEDGRLITLTKPRSPTSEAYRVLRTGIQFSSVDNPDRVSLMVTSANPSEGKSLTVANLAIVMAQAGHNVLVIDADLRRPVQHKIFRLPQQGGLTSLLLEVDMDAASNKTLEAIKKVIQPTSVEGLHVLTSGLIPPNPSELLGSVKMKRALATMAEHYDYVIIDSPPVLAVTDASILSQRSDGVLLVADAGNTRRGPLKQAVEQLMVGNAHLIGVVLNKLKPRSDGYYTYYYYRHSYYLEESEIEAEEQPVKNGKQNGGWRGKKRSPEATESSA